MRLLLRLLLRLRLRLVLDLLRLLRLHGDSRLELSDDLTPLSHQLPSLYDLTVGKYLLLHHNPLARHDDLLLLLHHVPGLPDEALLPHPLL